LEAIVEHLAEARRGAATDNQGVERWENVHSLLVAAGRKRRVELITRGDGKAPWAVPT
jgi:hypothetical protein